MLKFPCNYTLSVFLLAAIAPSVHAETRILGLGSPVSIHPAVRGQCPIRQYDSATLSKVNSLGTGSSFRGPAGGLDADTYDWRNTASGRDVGGMRETTLEFLRYARDYGAMPIITANMFGGGYKQTDGAWYCELVSPEKLAADWVRYVNVILQTYRQGDEGLMSGEDLRVYNSITGWGTKERLLNRTEAAVPRVEYWEIGNEPELPGFGGYIMNHYVAPADFPGRYRPIAQAMRAVDPTIKLGPCIMNPPDVNGSMLWLRALADDRGSPVDFVAYHPYYFGLRTSWGNVTGMCDALRSYKAVLANNSGRSREVMASSGRLDVEVMATEWNPWSWDASATQYSTMASGLATLEAILSMAEDDVRAAHFWLGAYAYPPMKAMFEITRDHMGDRMHANLQRLGVNPDTTPYRIYATGQAGVDRIAIWGLNFSDSAEISVDLAFDTSVRAIRSATLMRYGCSGEDSAGGDTGLLTTANLAWTSQDYTASVDPAGFSLRLDDAEVTLLILEVTRGELVRADFDRDRDVDMSDWGHMQTCLTSSYQPQNDPACVDARLDADLDVDEQDVARFLNCLTGAGLLPDGSACIP